jgi:F0F1-type ATP synthase delta subunit
MSEQVINAQSDFVLPASVVTKVDVARLAIEAERIDNELTASDVRSKIGSTAQVKPVMTQQFSDFIQQNNVSLDNSHDRTDLIKQLRQLKDRVPMIHMTFAVTADLESLQQLTQWLRTSVHPQAVIAVGLQPALVAGVYLRTPNHVHDLSLRAMLDGGHDLLVEELGALRGSR